MRRKFQDQLDELNKALIEMGSMCETAIKNSIKALLEGDYEFARKITDSDGEIDQKEREIESQCMKLILLQQPMAWDLRQISAALKIITDLERIGDQAADISEIVTLGHIKPLNVFGSLSDMAHAAAKMVTDSIDAFVGQDLEKAREVIAYDDVVDDYFDEVRVEMIDMIAENRIESEYFVDVIMIAKYFERIGDHATNVAEWVEYSITGLHKGEKI